MGVAATAGAVSAFKFRVSDSGVRIGSRGCSVASLSPGFESGFGRMIRVGTEDLVGVVVVAVADIRRRDEQLERVLLFPRKVSLFRIKNGIRRLRF